MKKLLLFVGIILAGCGVDSRLDSMDKKMDSVQKSAASMDQSLKETRDYIKTLSSILERLVNSLAPQPSPSPSPGMVSEISGDVFTDPQIDLSTKSIQELTALRDDLKKAVGYKQVFEGQVPNLIKFLKGLKIKNPDGNDAPAKAALINEIKSLILQL